MKDLKSKKLNNLLAKLNDAQASGTAYSVSAILPVLFSFVFLITLALTGLAEGDFMQSDAFRYASFLLPEIAFACIIGFFLKSAQTDVKDLVGKPSWKYFLIAIVLQIGLLSLAELNAWFLKLLGGLGYEEQEILIPSMDGFGFVGVLFVIAVLPAVMEETVFRGLILKGLRQSKEIYAVLLCGALFALYHQKPEQTVYQFCCGVAFALVALRSGSVLPTIVAHFINNAWVLIMTKFSLSLDAIYLPFLICSALCLAGSLAYLIFFDKNQRNERVNEKKSMKDFLIFSSVGIAVCGLSWLLAFFSGV